MGLWTFLRDDVSWAITVVGIILIAFAVGAFVVTGACDTTVITTGITGITALAGRNKANGQKEVGVSEVKN